MATTVNPRNRESQRSSTNRNNSTSSMKVLLYVLSFFILIFLIASIRDALKKEPAIVEIVGPTINNKKTLKLSPHSFTDYSVLENKGEVIIDTYSKYVYVKVQYRNGKYSKVERWRSGEGEDFPFTSNKAQKIWFKKYPNGIQKINVKQKKY